MCKTEKEIETLKIYEDLRLTIALLMGIVTKLENKFG